MDVAGQFAPGLRRELHSVLLQRAGGAKYSITGTTGLYDTEAKTLDLDGNVIVQQQDRFTARMDKAHIVVKDKTLTSDTAVTASFASGTVDANGMQITDDGNRILFLNGVKARFTAREGKGDTNP